MPATDEFGVHEVLHMSLFLAESVEGQLIDHDAIKQSPEWLKLAESAHAALFELYQKIGAARV